MRVPSCGGRCALVAMLLPLACHSGGPRFPWPGAADNVAFEHAEVRTVNAGYRRTTSRVLVREIDRPTRATLDYAAYNANFMNADAEPEDPAAAGVGARPDASHPFAGVFDATTLTASIRKTPLTPAERAHPLAFAPLVEYLATKNADAASGLEDVAAAVRAESWGLPGGPHIARQLAALVFLHDPGADAAAEVWVKVELWPWFKAFPDAPDEDGDGFPEVYGRVRADLIKPATLALIRDDYVGKPFGAAEVKSWANQLSSYWYPSYNTDLVKGAVVWPDDATESEVRGELGGRTFDTPAVVMRGKPQGKPVYNVFLLKTPDGKPAVRPAGPAATAPTPKLKRTTPTPTPGVVADVVRRELAAAGGGWDKWAASVAPFADSVRKREKSTPASVKGLPGLDGFLFFRNALDYVVGGDLEQQKPGKAPLPLIVEFRKLLADNGVDFLFVPVPTKSEVLPDKFDPAGKPFVGKVVNPFARKFALALTQAGVEVLDLLPAFLAERAKDATAKEPIYQAQDTHWSARGIDLAARLVAARVKQYPWYRELASHPRKYTVSDAPFVRHGDLHSRLAPALRGKYKPETLVGHQVKGPDGALYEDDADSPIIVLGDSFTGVYQLTDCQHAGISAHIAREISSPVDLVMSYGGGPNVRQTLMRRGVADLSRRKLVIYMMTARDLYNYSEGWDPLRLEAGK